MYDNPKRTHLWVNLGQPSTLTSKLNIHIKNVHLVGHEGYVVL